MRSESAEDTAAGSGCRSSWTLGRQPFGTRNYARWVIPTSLKGARGSRDASSVPIMGTRPSIELRGSMYISIGAAILILILLILFVF
jgi:hypothetical protein